MWTNRQATAFSIIIIQRTTKIMRKLGKITVFLLLLTMLQGCFLTKIVTVPMRLGGAVVSVVPGAGNSAHDAIDVAAETVDDIPI